ncbi:MAG: hypothetical protein Q8N22_02780 [bacterium]|nr:hypothetical protein [bacterium]
MYYDWLNGFITPLIKIFEKELRKGFVYDLRMAEMAAKHSDAMRKYNVDYSYHAPKEFWDTAFAELVGDPYYVFYDDWAIRQAMEEIAYKFLNSPAGHRSALEKYPVIGGGIALNQIGNGWVKVYTTLRLRY